MLNDLDSLMVDFGVDALYLGGQSIHRPNLYYVTNFLTVDQTYYVKAQDQNPVLIATDLVIERSRNLSSIQNFHSTSPKWQQGIVKKQPSLEIEKEIIIDIAKHLLPAKGVVGVPRDSDVFEVHQLQRLGFEVKPVHELFLKARETKSAKEITAINKASRATEATFQVVIEILQNCDIGANKVLMWEGKPLTVGRVKRIIDHALIDNDAENSQESIVTGGRKGSDFHYLGLRKDKLKAEEPIIIDIYPRRIEERHHADITRTVVRGSMSLKVKRMFEAVESALDAVIDAVAAGTLTSTLVDVMANSFERDGYPVAYKTPGIKEGMLHGLGHGIGLSVHEFPRLTITPTPLRENGVIAVEPGLYYKRIGGVRIEDDVLITKKGARRLTRLPRTFNL
jgi:Xaa-Pro aminopeptidase